MVGRDFKWVVGLVLVIASGAYWLHGSQSAPEPLRIELLLGSDCQFSGKFRLTLESNSQGAGFDTLLTVPGTRPPFDYHGRMDKATFEKLERQLTENGLWTVPSADESGPENLMLYTRLTATQGSRTHTSLWRGLPGKQYQALAGCFLQSPLDVSVGQGLQAVQAFKGEPSLGPHNK